MSLCLFAKLILPDLTKHVHYRVHILYALAYEMSTSTVGFPGIIQNIFHALRPKKRPAKQSVLRYIQFNSMIRLAFACLMHNLSDINL